MKKAPALVAVVLLECVALAQTSTPKTTYILAGRLFDATSEKVRENAVITIEGDRITAVSYAASARPPDGASVIDLSHYTVLPGLIDCHTHLEARADRYTKSTSSKTLLSIRPFTPSSMRARPSRRDSPPAPGPRISVTGGHGDLNNFSPQVRVSMFPGERNFQIADDASQIRHVVRGQVKYGWPGPGKHREREDGRTVAARQFRKSRQSPG